MMMGWASGTFGLFGLSKEDVKTPVYNFVGIAIVMVGMYVFLQVKTNEMHADGGPEEVTLYKSLSPEDEENDLAGNKQGKFKYSTDDYRTRSAGSFSGAHHVQQRAHELKGNITTDHFGSGWSQAKKRMVGLTMAVAAGLLFGASFNPSQYVIDNHYDGDDNSLNYVFPHFCGIWIASWSYLLLYGGHKYYHGESLYVNPECILPAALSGVMWGVACISWFVANGKLGFSIAFPLITSGPGFIGSMYGIFLFNEISGKRNFIILGVAFVITLTGLAFIASSH